MIATSGSVLADKDTIAAFTRLMRIATLVTPNLPELAALGGEAAIRALGPAVLIKGGHGEGADITDRLVTDAGETRWTNPRIETRHAHGTVCTLASAIATGLAQRLPLDAAIERAIAFVRAALANGPGLGAGHGPMGHALGVSPFDQLRTR
jgi:hydroxymethylpyrimidine/phosphomethylpyrimidine kinase